MRSSSSTRTAAEAYEGEGDVADTDMAPTVAKVAAAAAALSQREDEGDEYVCWERAVVVVAVDRARIVREVWRIRSRVRAALDESCMVVRRGCYVCVYVCVAGGGGER